jgi:hypothetical protein
MSVKAAPIKISTIPPELQRPVPRAVRFRQGPERAAGCFRVALIPFGAFAIYLLYLFVIATMKRPLEIGEVIFRLVVALIVNGLWLVFLYGILVKPWLAKRLCQCGTAVPARVVRKNRSPLTSKRRYFITCEFDHPGIGVRRIRAELTHRVWRSAGRRGPLTVLCYPNSKWPRLIYDFSAYECV